MSQKLKKAQFDFEDYLESMKQMKKMGGLANIMSMMPGLGGARMKDIDSEESEKKMAQIESIISDRQSTPESGYFKSIQKAQNCERRRGGHQ